MNFPFPWSDPSTEQLKSVRATDIQWRVADACCYAMQLYMHQFATTTNVRPPRWLGEGRVDFQLVAALCAQLSQQGLDPSDLDNTEGHAAIQAIAAAIMSSNQDPLQIRIHDEISVCVPAKTWQEVTLAAQYLLHQNVRCYRPDSQM